MPPELVGALERAAPPRSGGRIAIRARGRDSSRRMGPRRWFQLADHAMGRRGRKHGRDSGLHRRRDRAEARRGRRATQRGRTIRSLLEIRAHSP